MDNNLNTDSTVFTAQSIEALFQSNPCDPVEEGAFGPLYDYRLTIDDNGELRIACRHRDENGIPMSEWHGRTLSVPLGAYYTTPDIDSCQKIARMLTTICAGHVVEWNGSNNVGRQSQDSSYALAELTEFFESYPHHITRYADYDWCFDLIRDEAKNVIAGKVTVDEVIQRWAGDTQTDDGTTTVINGDDFRGWLESMVAEIKEDDKA